MVPRVDEQDAMWNRSVPCFKRVRISDRDDPHPHDCTRSAWAPTDEIRRIRQRVAERARQQRNAKRASVAATGVRDDQPRIRTQAGSQADLWAPLVRLA